jgi:DNA (cytosine-5)-methyltransferase 1
VIGGPPCQAFSQINQAARKGLQELAANLIPEFQRVVFEAAPSWFVMENVRQAPEPAVCGYDVRPVLFNNRWLGEEQNRVRRFTLGMSPAGGGQAAALDRFEAALRAQDVGLESAERAGCFTANGSQWDAGKGRGRGDRTWKSLHRGLRLQGLPEDFFEGTPFTAEGAVSAVGNGVPLRLGRAVARAVKVALRIGLASVGPALEEVAGG